MPLKPAKGQSSSQQLLERHPRKVTGITSWVQRFASYMHFGVLSGTSLDAVPELMANLIHIMRVSQEFRGRVWVSYDVAYRRQAVTTSSR